MNVLQFSKLCASVTALALLIFKYSSYVQFKEGYNKWVKFKVLYNRNEIDGTSSNERREYMQVSNRITAAFAVFLLMAIVLFIVPRLLGIY